MNHTMRIPRFCGFCRNHFGARQLYACFSLSTRPAVPFFHCWAVVDDFGNLVEVQL